MITDVRISGRDDRLEWRKNGETCWFRFQSHPERTAQVQCVEPGAYSVLVEGASYDVRVESGGNGVCYVSLAGRRYEVEVRDPRRWTGSAQGRQLHGRESVAAPMPGKVIRVLVSAGDRVAAGQGLVVVEAMKMQNEMRAARDGAVAAVHVVSGDTVIAGQVLVVIE